MKKINFKLRHSIHHTLCALLLLIGGFNHASAQNRTHYDVKGIAQYLNKQPLAYATVRIVSQNRLISISSCDSSGHFNMTYPDSVHSDCFIYAEYLTRKSALKLLSRRDEFQILAIDTATTALKEVKIVDVEPTITRKGDRYIYLPGSGNQVKGVNALDAMRHVPLINYDDRTDMFSIINKSGTIVYINGVKSQIPTEMLQQTLRSLPASDIKSVEIITNPGSEYAASTQGGIININLKRQLYEGWLGNLTVSSQQSNYNTSVLNGSVSYRKNKIAIQLIPFINNSYNYNQEFDDLNYQNGLVQHNSSTYFRRYSVIGGGINLDYNINEKSFLSFKYWRTNVYGNSRNTDKSVFFNSSQQGRDSTVSSPYRGNDFYTYNFGNINYRYNFDKQNNSYLSVNFDYNHFFQRRNITGDFSTIDPVNETVISQSGYYNYLPQNFNNYSASIDFKKPLLYSIDFISGVQFSSTSDISNLKYHSSTNGVNTLIDSLSNDYQYNERYVAAYVNFSKSISKKLYASVGLRLENTEYSTSINNRGLKRDSSYWNLFPSASISYVPNPNNQFSYSLSRKIVRPNIESLFPGRTYNGPNDYTENNPFLEPSVFLGNELTYLFKQKYSLSLNYAVAHNSFSQFTIPVQGNQIKTTYLNYGSVNNLSVVLYGSQTLVSKIWDMYLTPYFNYGHYSGTIASSNINVTNKNINVVIDNAVYLPKNYTAYLTFKYFGTSQDISQRTLNATSTLNFSIRKVAKHFTYMLFVNDILNSSSVNSYDRFTNYLLTRNYANIDRFNRSLSVQVRYSFGNSKLAGNKNRNTANEELKNRVN